MWLPMHFLSACALISLTHLQVKVPAFSGVTDLRAYNTFFRQTADLVIKVRDTLQSLVVVFGQSRESYRDIGPKRECGTSRNSRLRCYRPWCILMAKLFLEPQVAALNEHAFPRLEEIRFEGFHLLEDASDSEAADAGLASVFQAIDECRFVDTTFTSVQSFDEPYCFEGHEDNGRDEGRFAGLLRSS